MLDKLDGRAPTQDGVQPLPPVTEITPPKPSSGEGNGDAKEKKQGDGDESTDGDGNKVEGNGTAANTRQVNATRLCCAFPVRSHLPELKFYLCMYNTWAAKRVHAKNIQALVHVCVPL